MKEIDEVLKKVKMVHFIGSLRYFIQKDMK